MISALFCVPNWVRITLNLIYIGIVALLSLLPSNSLPKVHLFEGADKIVHFCMYLGLTMLSCWTIHAELNSARYSLLVILPISWGIIMEILQYLMQIGRSFEFVDILSNSIGAFCGLFLYLLIAGKIKLLKQF